MPLNYLHLQMKPRKADRLLYLLRKNSIFEVGKLNSLIQCLFHSTAQTRMSGIDIKIPDGKTKRIRKGAADSIKKFVESNDGFFPTNVAEIVSSIAMKGCYTTGSC